MVEIVGKGGGNNYISKYRKAFQAFTKFKKASFEEQYNSFVPLIMFYMEQDCRGLICNMVKALKLPDDAESADKISALYVIAVFANPFSIREMKAAYITEKIGEIATIEHGSLLAYIPHAVRTFEMYARKHRAELELIESLDTISSVVRCIDFNALWKRLDAKSQFGIELEFIPDCEAVFVKKFIEAALKRCSNIVDSSKTFKLTPDLSAPSMYEVTTQPVTSWDILATWYCIMLCLNSLSKFKLLRVNDSCGTHVHIDKSDTTYAVVKDIEKVYLDNITVINRLITPKRVFNNYCVPSVCSPRKTEEELMAMSAEELKKDKYHVVNTNAWFYFKTMEFRQYNSTLDIKSLLSWVEFLHKLVNNYETVGRCLTTKELFNRINLSEQASSVFVTKFMKNNRLF